MILLLSLLVVLVLMVTAISRWNLHPFLAIILAAFVLAFAVGIPLSQIVGIIESGFSSILSSIGLVIVFGALIGSILEKTGGALKLADLVVQRLGHRYPQLSVMIIGWIISIPVFCDSGFILLSPIRRAIAHKTGASAVGMTLALAAGLYTSHVFLPPTPGPVAAAGMMGMESNLLLIIGMGLLISPFCLFPTYLFIQYIGKKSVPHAEEQCSDPHQEYTRLLESFGTLPGGWLSALPILVPILLMTMGSVAPFLTNHQSTVAFTSFLGKPMVALLVGLLFGIGLLIRSGRAAELTNITNDTLKAVGPIVFITAAGSVLGKVIASTNLVEIIRQEVPILIGMGIFFPFLISALLKTAQGSSTVAITTTASLLGYFSAGDSLMAALGLQTPVMAALTIMAIGAGAMTVSHANDSYFWVVTGFGKITPGEGYRTHTLMTLVMGLSSMAAIALIAAVVKKLF